MIGKHPCGVCHFELTESKEGQESVKHGATRDRSIVQEGNGSVRFVSVPDFSKINRFASVRFGNVFFPVRRGSACVFRTRRGSVRSGSVRFHVRFRPVPELNGSVRFGSAGSVRFLIRS